jgi:hypothetical protein
MTVLLPEKKSFTRRRSFLPGDTSHDYVFDISCISLIFRPEYYEEIFEGNHKQELLA